MSAKTWAHKRPGDPKAIPSSSLVFPKTPSYRSDVFHFRCSAGTLCGSTIVPMWMYIYIYCCCGCGVFLLLVLLFLWDIYTLVVLRVCCHCTSPGLVSDGVPRMVSFSAAATGIARAQHLRRISIQSAIWSPSKQYRIKYIFNVLILGQRTQIYSIFIQTQALYSNVMHSSFIRFHPIFSLPYESLIYDDLPFRGKLSQIPFPIFV